MVVGAVVLGIAAVLVAGMVLLCATGRIPRNPYVGIRIPSLFASDEAWVAGHRAALAPTIVGAVASLVFAGLGAADPTFAVAAFILTLVAIVAGLVVGAVLASRAAPPSTRS